MHRVRASRLPGLDPQMARRLQKFLRCIAKEVGR
jgi:hypothetical protein